ncbi:MAG: hypothetical protein U0790_28280 [Isosphaeraceae bacterium]
MQKVTNDNFGPLIAYLVPGATVLAAVSPFSPTLQAWLAASPPTAPSLGGFLYATVASLAVGMTLSAFRWAIVDTAHRLTGLAPPVLDFAALGENVDAFVLLIEIHYRHYQFYANMLLATAVAYACYRARLGGWAVGWADLGVLVLEAVFLATSRDTLRKYYTRTRQLLGGRLLAVP